MDSLQKTALCLLFLSISSGASDSHFASYNCSSIKTEYNKTAVISCNSSKKITNVAVKHCESCAKENSSFKTVINTWEKKFLSEDGRIQLKLHTYSAEVHIQKVKATDQGDYKWNLYSDSGEDHRCTALEITAPETEPNFIWNGTELSCQSPIGHQQRQIHWFNGHGTNLTGRASLVAEEVEGGLTSLTSTLHESPNLTASGYCCVVVYDMHTKRNKTKCLSADTVENYLRFTSNSGLEIPKTGKSHVATILVLLFLVLCCFAVMLYYKYRRRAAVKRNLVDLFRSLSLILRQHDREDENGFTDDKAVENEPNLSKQPGV